MKKALLFLFLGVVLLNNVFSSCSSGQININTASAEELDKIIYIGPATALKIIAAQPFNSVNDLLNVSGIGEIKLNAIKNEGLACVEGESTISNEKENITDTEEKEDENETLLEVEQDNKNLEEKNLPETILENNTKFQEFNTNIVPQVIKIENNYKNPDKKNKYAFYGLISFSILLCFLLIFKKIKTKEQDKNELS